MTKFIPVCNPWLPGNEEKYVKEAIETGWISSSGKYIEKFELAFSKFCGVDYGVACTNCFAALHLACLAIGLKKGDEVIVPSFTMISPLSAVILTGAKPVLVDCNNETYCIDVNKIEEKITPKTKAIMPVHIYGQACDMDKILQIASKYNLKIIEDCAEAHGAEYKGKKVGSFSDIACFSFYGNKIITTGEGGMVITNNKDYYEKIKKLRNYAFEHPRFLHKELSVNYRMSNLHAAIGLAQTENAELLVNARRNMGLRYNKLLKDIPGIKLPVERENCKNVFWMYGIILKDEIKASRDEIVEKLNEKGVDTRNFFIPMHKQPFFLEKKFENAPDCSGNYPVSEKISERGFYIPSSSNLIDEEAEFVVEKLKEVLDENIVNMIKYDVNEEGKIGEREIIVKGFGDINKKEIIVKGFGDINKKEKIVVTSGWFDPIHIGHIELFKLAKELAGKDGKLIVILNNDKQAVLKKGMPFMPLEERKKIIEALKDVDEVFVSIDEDLTVCKSLEAVRPDIFAKGGDRFAYEIPEAEICKKLGIKIVDGLGEKIRSSREFYDNKEKLNI